MPLLIKVWFIEKLGKKLLISRKTEKAQFHRTAQHVKQVNALSAMNILEKQFQKTLFELEVPEQLLPNETRSLDSYYGQEEAGSSERRELTLP